MNSADEPRNRSWLSPNPAIDPSSSSRTTDVVTTSREFAK